MIFKNLPAIITLVAALVACVVTFLYRYELTKALILILAATVVFFIMTSCVGLDFRVRQPPDASRGFTASFYRDF